MRKVVTGSNSFLPPVCEFSERIALTIFTMASNSFSISELLTFTLLFLYIAIASSISFTCRSFRIICGSNCLSIASTSSLFWTTSSTKLWLETMRIEPIPPKKFCNFSINCACRLCCVKFILRRTRYGNRLLSGRDSRVATIEPSPSRNPATYALENFLLSTSHGIAFMGYIISYPLKVPPLWVGFYLEITLQGDKFYLSPIGGAQALPSPRRHWLGRPLPYQLPDTDEADPKAILNKEKSLLRRDHRVLPNLSTSYSRLSGSYLVITTSSAGCPKYCYRGPPWLACLIHAASVHPELGSNSYYKFRRKTSRTNFHMPQSLSSKSNGTK